jgi:hypothetical protein
MVDYAIAFKRPFENTKTAIIGSVLGILGAITFGIISLFVWGFAFKNAQETIKGNNKLLEFKDWIEYFIKGILITILTIIYFLPALILLGLAFITALPLLIKTLITGDPTPLLSVIGVSGSLILLGIILGLIALIVLPMAIALWQKENKFSSAFHCKRILKGVLTGKYFLSLIIVFVYWIALSIIVGILSLIPLIGTYIGAGITTYIGAITTYTVFAQVVKELNI